MDIATATDIVKKVHGKKGWTIEPLIADSETNTLLIDVRFRTDDSSIEFAPNYGPQVSSGRRFGIELDKVRNEQELHRDIINGFIATEIHELREFYRVGPDFYAPFHPHQFEGNNAWDETENAQGLMWSEDEFQPVLFELL